MSEIDFFFKIVQLDQFRSFFSLAFTMNLLFFFLLKKKFNPNYWLLLIKKNDIDIDQRSFILMNVKKTTMPMDNNIITLTLSTTISILELNFFFWTKSPRIWFEFWPSSSNQPFSHFWLGIFNWIDWFLFYISIWQLHLIGYQTNRSISINHNRYNRKSMAR